MSFSEAIRTVLSKYSDFSGRAMRSEYWWWTLFVFLLTIATGIIDQLAISPGLGYEPFADETPEILTMIVSLALLIPGLAVAVRRLHDTERSGWWLLIMFVPLIGLLVLIYWFVLRGTEGPNRFGPDPLQDAGV